MHYKVNQVVCWYDDNGELICTSSIAIGNLIDGLMKKYRTWHNVLDYVRYNKEARDVCRKHIERGMD